MSNKEILDSWDGELTAEAIVSRLLHLQPTEANFFQGLKEIELLIKKEKYEQERERDK